MSYGLRCKEPYISGISNCSWSSCREGCTREIFECHHVKVEYSSLEEDYQTLSEKKTSQPTRTASLFVNVKGCGYPPTVQCTDWIREYGTNNSTIPCYYSRSDHTMAITHMDTKNARRDVLLSIFIPLATILLSGSALCLLHTRCLRTILVKTAHHR